MKRTSKDFFESIGEFHHNIGIYLTYTLETQVIDKLTEYATGTILILHDYTQGKNLNDNCNSSIACLSVKTLRKHDKNCFHSKLALLKSESGAKLIVGSVNLSTDSFVSEKEIAFEIEMKFDEQKDVFLYNRILKFIESLEEQILVPNKVLSETLEKLRYKELPESLSDIEFVYNSKDSSIFERLKKYISNHRRTQKAKSIKIATPFVSNDYPTIAIDELKEISSNISVYLRKGAKIDPFKKNQFKIFQPTSKKREGFHAKLVLIEFNNDAVLYIGSANFTDQGFFKNLNQSANQECGVVLKVPKNEMGEWFDEKLWKQLSDEELENYKEADDNSLESKEQEMEYYAWAEKETNKVITYIFNPHNYHVSKTKDGKKINLQQVYEGCLFKTDELEMQNGTIIFYIREEKVSIAVFEFNEYRTALNEKGESIFDSFTFKGIYSVNPKEMDDAISKEKISVSETTKIEIIEPPKLEQYFRNVKELLQHIKDKKYFSEYNEIEIQEEIRKSNDGRSMYLALQLLKLFKSKPNIDNLNRLCEKRIDELSEELPIDKKKLNKFLKEWLTSKI